MILRLSIQCKVGTDIQKHITKERRGKWASNISSFHHNCTKSNVHYLVPEQCVTTRQRTAEAADTAQHLKPSLVTQWSVQGKLHVPTACVAVKHFSPFHYHKTSCTHPTASLLSVQSCPRGKRFYRSDLPRQICTPPCPRVCWATLFSCSLIHPCVAMDVCTY